jgi:hypothetical protein
VCEREYVCEHVVRVCVPIPDAAYPAFKPIGITASCVCVCDHVCEHVCLCVSECVCGRLIIKPPPAGGHRAEDDHQQVQHRGQARHHRHAGAL